MTGDGADRATNDLRLTQVGDSNNGEVQRWSLADGTNIRVRHLRSTDHELEKEFIRSLSERSRYFRMMTPLRYLSPDLLAHLMDVDGNKRVALVATLQTDARERFIAVARFAQTEEPDKAELGITVADAWQRRGIASRLLGLLIECAHQHGMRKLIGFVLPDNHPMLALARKLGFEVHLDPTSRLMNIEIDTSVVARG